MGVMLSPKLGYQNQDVIEFDEAMSSFIYNSHSNLIDHFMIVLSTYGREIVWVAVIVFMSIFTGWKGKKNCYNYDNFFFDNHASKHIIQVFF